MKKKCFKIGKCSKYFIYILVTGFTFIIKNSILSLRELNFDTDYNIIGIKVVLRNHALLKLLLEYIGYILFGLISKYIYKKKYIKSEFEINRTYSVESIHGHYRTYKLLLIACCAFSVQLIVRSILTSCRVWMLDLWVFNIIFINIFMKYLLNKNLYKHQLYYLLLIFSINIILLITASSIIYNGTSDYISTADLYGNYYVIILFYIIFLILSFLISYSQVMQKKIMEISYISPFIVILLIGIISAFFSIITLIITTNVSCNDFLTDNGLCSIRDEKGHGYFDNFNIFLQNLGDQYNSSKLDFFLEIFIVYPLYAFIGFFKYFYETLIVLYLNPNYVLLSDNIFYSFKKIVFLCYNSTDVPIILKLLGEMIAVIGYCLYLEIFIIDCCGLSYFTKPSIYRRSLMDNTEFLEQDSEDSISSDFEEKENDNSQVK